MKKAQHAYLLNRKKNVHLVAAYTRFKIQIGYVHFLKTEGTFGVLLLSRYVQPSKTLIFCTYCLIIAPIRVLDAG